MMHKCASTHVIRGKACEVSENGSEVEAAPAGVPAAGVTVRRSTISIRWDSKNAPHMMTRCAR